MLKLHGKAKSEKHRIKIMVTSEQEKKQEVHKQWASKIMLIILGRW